jgi:hypothetical protein
MTIATLAFVEKANRPTSNLGSRSPQSGDVNKQISEVVKTLRDIKPWSYLVDVFGVSDGAARKKVNLEREYSPNEIALLLRSEDGFAFLSEIMSKAPRPPLWWRICRPLMASTDAARLQQRALRIAQRTLKEALNADADLTATLARGQAALMLHDEEFYGARLAPVGEREAGASDRKGRAPAAADQPVRRAAAGRR